MRDNAGRRSPAPGTCHTTRHEVCAPRTLPQHDCVTPRRRGGLREPTPCPAAPCCPPKRARACSASRPTAPRWPGTTSWTRRTSPSSARGGAPLTASASPSSSACCATPARGSGRASTRPRRCSPSSQGSSACRSPPSPTTPGAIKPAASTPPSSRPRCACAASAWPTGASVLSGLAPGLTARALTEPAGSGSAAQQASGGGGDRARRRLRLAQAKRMPNSLGFSLWMLAAVSATCSALSENPSTTAERAMPASSRPVQ